MIRVNNNFILSEEKANKLYEAKFDIPRLFLTGRDVITAAQLYDFIPWDVYIEQDLCEIAVGNDIVDGDAVYIVSYIRKKDGWIAQSFYATTLHDALYEMIMWCNENGLIPQSSFRCIPENTERIKSCDLVKDEKYAQTTNKLNYKCETTYTTFTTTYEGNETNTLNINSDCIQYIIK